MSATPSPSSSSGPERCSPDIHLNESESSSSVMLPDVCFSPSAVGALPSGSNRMLSPAANMPRRPSSGSIVHDLMSPQVSSQWSSAALGLQPTLLPESACPNRAQPMSIGETYSGEDSPTLRISDTSSGGERLTLPEAIAPPSRPASFMLRPFVIGVCGGTASGKTTVCNQLEALLADEDVGFLPSDAFYKNLNEEEKKKAYAGDFDFDSPDAIDFEELKQCVRDLRSWHDVHIPLYDFTRHTRKEETTTLKAHQVIIVEGILIFNDPELRDLMDLKIFVECDADIRLARRVIRDIAERGRELENVLGQYQRFVKPSYEKYVEPGKRFADVIIPNIGESINYVAIDIISQHIRLQLAARKRRKHHVRRAHTHYRHHHRHDSSLTDAGLTPTRYSAEGVQDTSHSSDGVGLQGLLIDRMSLNRLINTPKN
ncbi:hypothetical protein FOL47_003888 [Perkinsus chesapeaki]|uniref:uridine/cytidine kinase n=1 Tax=Perkinsus chesapeaki TaxID=330153 RepID=A0A7J6M5S9_PERCH|nr:hypothetical protein FOL47_003888 [Perkinsus chesapeaki]